jgi:predicted unusual protein kinase regulating ubiquinone biosynthesis (AarF/ABC1/UbiB family)
MELVKAEGPRGTLERGLRLGRLGLTLTGSYLGYQFQRLWLDEAEQSRRREGLQRNASRRVREELGLLKGPMMKIGQLVSMQSHALPEAAMAELASLQMQAPGMHATLARAQFKSSLGRYPEELFRTFEPEPFAAASLGQVHRAVSKRGERLAVKIQYPAIREAVQNDFKLLRSATLPGRLTGHAPASIFDEVQRGFLEETDYLHEGANIDFFREALREYGYLDLPRVHRDLTTERVLTMSFVEGLHIADWLRTRPGQGLRDLVGARLFEQFNVQIARVQALHADPHPGNYLLREDGRIGLVDFGCVKRLTPDVEELNWRLVSRSWLEGPAQMERVIGLLWGPHVSRPKARRMMTDLGGYIDLVFPRGPDAGVVDFGKPTILNSLSQAMRRAVSDKLTNPEFAFVSRAELGLYCLLHQLRARVKTTEVWEGVQQRDGGRKM